MIAAKDPIVFVRLKIAKSIIVNTEMLNGMIRCVRRFKINCEQFDSGI